MNHEKLLRQVLKSLNAPPDAFYQFLRYHQLLLEWNHRTNLISKHDETNIVLRHFIESFSLLKAYDFPQFVRILDIGTGAGFPGIPMHLVRPDIDLVLIEATRKKGLFLKKLVSELGLTREISIIIGRAENSNQILDPVDIICSRAVAEASALAEWGVHFLKDSGGRILMLKGANAEKELESISSTLKGRSVRQLKYFQLKPFPGLIANMQIHIIEIGIGE